MKAISNMLDYISNFQKKELYWINNHISSVHFSSEGGRLLDRSVQQPAEARGKFVYAAKVLAAMPSISQPGSFISNFLY